MEHQDRQEILFKIMSFALGLSILFSTACQAPPTQPGRRRVINGEDIATADPDDTPPPESDQTPRFTPSTQPEYTYAAIPPRPRDVRGNLDREPGRNWRYIVIHHSGTGTGSMNAFDRHARENLGWKGVGYHFVIGNGHGSRDGLVEVTFRWEEQIHGAHAGVERYNDQGIGICLVGEYDHGYPTRRQIEALASLTIFLQERNNIPTSEIYLHRHIKNTACPGENFPFYKFISLLER